MIVYLVHHGAALPPELDPQQPLSAMGRREVDRLAVLAREHGVRPDVFWHSGKLRARQTAEALWRSCNALGVFEAARGIQPGDPPTWLCDRLRAERRDILVAGHLPHIELVLRALTRAPDTEFPRHAIVAVETTDDGVSWREAWRLH